MAQSSTSTAASSRRAETAESGVLICTQDAELYLLLDHIIAVAGYQPTLACNDADVVARLDKQGALVAILVDIASWSGDLDELCRRARDGGQRVCALITPGRNAAHLRLIKAGIDDGIARPLSPSRLLDFLRSAAERRSPPKPSAGPAMIQPVLQAAGAVILVDGRRLDVTAIEAKILLALASSQASPCSREAIVRAAWPQEQCISMRTVDAHVARLRKRLAGRPELRIATVYGKGYALVLK